jgi:hypothetical protein
VAAQERERIANEQGRSVSLASQDDQDQEDRDGNSDQATAAPAKTLLD